MSASGFLLIKRHRASRDEGAGKELSWCRCGWDGCGTSLPTGKDRGAHVAYRLVDTQSLGQVSLLGAGDQL